MTPAARATSTGTFLSAQIHYGLGRNATPSQVALTILRQSARDIAACIEADPSIRLTLPGPPGFLDNLLAFAKEL